MRGKRENLRLLHVEDDDGRQPQRRPRQRSGRLARRHFAVRGRACGFRSFVRFGAQPFESGRKPLGACRWGTPHGTFVPFVRRGPCRTTLRAFAEQQPFSAQSRCPRRAQPQRRRPQRAQCAQGGRPQRRRSQSVRPQRRPAYRKRLSCPGPETLGRAAARSAAVPGKGGDCMLFVLSGGGTAGHINPALALAEVLKERGHDVAFAGTPQGIEARLGTGGGPAVQAVRGRRVQPAPSEDAAAGACAKINAEHEDGRGAGSTRSIRMCVVGFGGYVCIPVARAAEKHGHPRGGARAELGHGRGEQVPGEEGCRRVH